MWRGPETYFKFKLFVIKTAGKFSRGNFGRKKLVISPTICHGHRNSRCGLKEVEVLLFFQLVFGGLFLLLPGPFR